MASERERQKKLRALIRQIINSNLSVRLSDARKIVEIGRECVPIILEFVGDEKRWGEIIHGDISPLTAMALLGAIGSPDALEDVYSAITRHVDDLDMIDYLIPSILASCARGRSDFLLTNALDPSLGMIPRLTCLDAISALVEIEPDSREAIGQKLAGYLSSSSGDPEFNGYLIDTLLDVDGESHLREIEYAFSRSEVDEKVIDIDIVRKLTGPDRREDLLRDSYKAPISFFEAENMKSVRTEIEDRGEEDDDDEDEDLADEQPSTMQEAAELLIRKAEAIYRETGRNDTCFCHSGKKFKNCCLPIIQERKRISLKEDRLRKVIMEFNDSGAGEKLIERGFKAFNSGERILMEDDILLLTDWYCHDYIHDGGKTTIDLVIENKRGELDEESVATLRSWKSSVFSLYAVVEVKKWTGYVVEDLFLEPGRRFFVSEISGSFFMKRYELLFCRMYDFGKINRTSGGALNGPYMLKSRLLQVMEKMLQKYMSENNLIQHDNMVSLRRKFLRQESRNLIFALMEEIEKRRNVKMVTPEGHDLKYCTGIFELKETGASVRALREYPSFVQNGEDGAHVFIWVDPGSRIPVSSGVNDGETSTVRIESQTMAGFSGKDDDKPRRIYGNIKIENFALTLSALSMERYHALKSLVHEILGGQVIKELSERFEDMPGKDDGGYDETDEETTESSGTDDETYREPDEEEIQRELLRQKIMLRSYSEWLDEKVPALDNMTPREAAKEPGMRGRVEDLLREIDYQLGDEILFLMPMLRSELGLEEKDTFH